MTNEMSARSGLIQIINRPALEEAAGARCIFRERDHVIVSLPGGDSGRRGSRGRKAAPLAM